MVRKSFEIIIRKYFFEILAEKGTNICIKLKLRGAS